MKSRRTSQFRKQFAKLPEHAQRQANAAYRLFAQDPWHPGLHFKRVSKARAVYSVRIERGYRALGVLQDDTVAWFWIGSHAEYDKLLARLQ